MKVYAKLGAIQAELKAPKSQFNKFGNYKYRKAEDILEAVKPLAAKQGCAITCTDDLIMMGTRYYIKATAIITCIEDGSQVSTTAFAREEDDKKGMDQSQVTGASSSYARKYALNGLLAIDDTADSDTTNVGDQGQQPGQQKPASKGRGGKQTMPAGFVTPGKKPCPERGTDCWCQWVEAIVTNKPGKSGEKQDWLAVFKNTYSCTQDQLDCLDEDILNYRLQSGIRAQ